MRLTIALVATVANYAAAVELETKNEAKLSEFTPISMENVSAPSTEDTSSDKPSDAENNTTTASEPKITADTVIAQPEVVNE